jgi:hypothetical protein
MSSLVRDLAAWLGWETWILSRLVLRLHALRFPDEWPLSNSDADFEEKVTYDKADEWEILAQQWDVQDV